MARLCVLLALCAAPFLQAALLKDVPLGECYDCEVTCFEDCAMKFKREVMSADSKKSLLQLEAPEQNQTSGLTEEYNECLETEKCKCRKSSKGLALVAGGGKKCAVGEMSCSSKCAGQVVDNDIAARQKQAVVATKTGLLQKKAFPLHAVKINAFATGKLKLDHCLKYCLAATCGCNDAAGFNSADDVKAALKANAASGAVVDTPKSPQYRLAKIEECGKGMLGKKVNKNLYIKIDGGAGGMYEVCTEKFLSKLMGPGDHSKVTTRCNSMASDDAKYGCLWDNDKGFCHVGFSPILRCQVEYFDDPTL